LRRWRVPTSKFRETNVSGNPHGATTIRTSKGGGAPKWLIGGVAAVVLAGGAYAAWKTIGPGQDQTQVAYEDPYAEDPLRAGPVDTAGEDALAESAATEDSAAPARPARRPAARDEVVPEETIGITPVNATSEESASPDESEEVVVRPQPRPVWARTPGERRLTALYPERARERGREGEARLSCMVQSGGALDCERVEETSAVFGAAALRVASTYRHAPTRADGSDAVGTPVNMRVVFRLEDADRTGRRFSSR
jgi:TonB family protein